MATLFEETAINGMTMGDRMAISANWEGMFNQEGSPTEELINCYCDLTQGGIGLIVSGYTLVCTEGKPLPGEMGIYTDDFEEDYKSLTSAVHYADGKIAVQLVHAGGQTDAGNADRQPCAPSALQVDQSPEIPAELTSNEISDLVAAFREGGSWVWDPMSETYTREAMTKCSAWSRGWRACTP